MKYLIIKQTTTDDGDFKGKLGVAITTNSEEDKGIEEKN